VDSYYVIINSRRGVVTRDTPAHTGGFNHVILAIKLPDSVDDPSLFAVLTHPTLGRLLFFDPTNELAPLGQIGGYLQANYGLLVGPDGGELVQLPKQPTTLNGVRRVAKFSLDSSGDLQGDVQEFRVGDRAWSQRWQIRAAASENERVKPIETVLSHSLSGFRLTKASLINLHNPDQPFGFDYSFVSSNYAQRAGDLMLVRPRVLGTKATGLLETREPRNFPVEFDAPARDVDTFEITLPPGYVVDELPPPVDVDYSFASYHSKTEVKGNVIDYSRTFEIKELSVPTDKAQELRKFYRIIATDERSAAVLRPSK
jgi:hypothetical protein